MSVTKLYTHEMTREAWLDVRRKSIGGSDAAAIVGLNNYSSPIRVWADKTGRLPAKETSEAMRQGNDLEEYVARRFSEATGKKVRRSNAIYYNDEYPFAHANVDRLIDGEDAGLECKTTSALSLKSFAGGEYPDRYYVQCQHYMAVTGRTKWYLAVLVLGRDFKIFEIARDEDEINALMDAEVDFWQHVIKDEMPDVSENDDDAEVLATLLPEDNGDAVELFGRGAILDELDEVKARIKELENRKAEIENTIKKDMGEASEGFCRDWRVTWRASERRTVDTKALKAALPELDLEPFYKVSKTRRFIVKKIREG